MKPDNNYHTRLEIDKTHMIPFYISIIVIGIMTGIGSRYILMDNRYSFWHSIVGYAIAILVTISTIFALKDKIKTEALFLDVTDNFIYVSLALKLIVILQNLNTEHFWVLGVLIAYNICIITTIRHRIAMIRDNLQKQILYKKYYEDKSEESR